MSEKFGNGNEIKTQGDKVANRSMKASVIVLILSAFLVLLGIFLFVGFS